MEMEQTERSETSAYEIQTPGNHPKESTQHSGHGESLESRIVLAVCNRHREGGTRVVGLNDITFRRAPSNRVALTMCSLCRLAHGLLYSRRSALHCALCLSLMSAEQYYGFNSRDASVDPLDFTLVSGPSPMTISRTSNWYVLISVCVPVTWWHTLSGRCLGHNCAAGDCSVSGSFMYCVAGHLPFRDRARGGYYYYYYYYYYYRKITVLLWKFPGVARSSFGKDRLEERQSVEKWRK